MPLAVFLLGHAGSGKTRLAKRWIRSRLKKGEHWALLDKDICGEALANTLMSFLGLNPNDRDSPEYKKFVRDVEYQNCLNIAKDQLKLGINVIMPGPWNKELENGRLFSVKDLEFPEDTVLRHIYLNSSIEKMKNRVYERDNPRDKWKKENWGVFEKTLVIPMAIIERAIPMVNVTGDLELDVEVLKNIFKKMSAGPA